MLRLLGGATNLPGGQRIIRQMFFVQLGGGAHPTPYNTGAYAYLVEADGITPVLDAQGQRTLVSYATFLLDVCVQGSGAQPVGQHTAPPGQPAPLTAS